MAADFTKRQMPVNPCCNCQVCKERYSKLQEKRNALRQALKLLEQQLDKIQADNLRLKKAYEVEKARAEDEKKGREKEVATRVPLETEIATLKSEISLLQQKGVSPAQDRSEEVKCLQDRVSEGEKEISRVKNLLEKEKRRADLEKKNVAEEKKRAVEAWKYVKAEKGKVDEERKIADIERKKVEEYSLQLEASSKEADDANSKLEEGNKKLEALKQQVTKERKRADSEMAKAKEQRRLAEVNRKQAEEEKCRAENFSQQLEEVRGRNEKLEKKMRELVRSRYSSETLGGKPNKTTNAEFSKMDLGIEVGRRVGSQTELVLKPVEQSKRSEVEKQKAISKMKLAEIEMDKSHEYRKLAELSQKKAIEEKYRADQLSQQLEEARGRIDELQKRIHDLLSSRKLVEASAVSPEKHSNTESVKVKDLKKQLKFEKMRVKHAKEVAKLEKSRNSILQQELGRLKLDFVQFIHRLDVLDKCFSTDAECIGYLGKEKVRDRSDMQMLKLKETLSGLEPFQMFLPREKELSKPCSTAITGSGPPRQTVHHIAPVLPLSGANCSESISGIDSKDSKLGSLLGGSSRKILQSSAINSISASFSDGQLVGSQERGAFSVTTSSKMIEESLNAQPTNSSMPGEVERMRCNGNLAVVDENSVRSPLKIGGVGNVGGPSRKRKRIVDAIESIELLRKLHLQMEEEMSDLHDMLNRQVEKYSKDTKYKVSNLQENSYFKQDKFHKKRKTSHRESVGIRNLLHSNESKKTAKTDAKVHEDAMISRQASEHATDLIRFAHTCAEGIRDSVINNHETMVNFEEVANGDYMKLLDLDNPAEEECYKTATEMLLSPTLPEIYFQGGETVDVDIIKPLQQKRFYGCLSNEKENSGPSYCFDVINVEINSNELKYDVSGTSHCSSLHENEGPVDSHECQHIYRNGFHSTLQAGKVCDHQAQDFGMEMVISDLCGSRDKGVALGTAHKNIINHFIVSHDIEDSRSISRVFCATRTCMAQCSLATERGLVLRKILLALKTEENLLSKEKACVFFSLLLVNFSTAAVGKSGNFLNSDFILCLDSFHGDVRAVMSDAEARSVFDKLCLDELLRLIENFLMDGRVLKYSEESSQSPIDCNSKINIVLDGVNTILSSEAASTDQLVAGSIILASICAATDHTGFICEASYNIFRMHRCDLSLVLTILHIFAYLGREKYFTLREHNLTMTVLKSMVTCIERRSSSVAETACPSSAHQVRAKFHPCTKCPFSKDAVSVDIAISLLLKKLQSYALSGTMNALSHKDQAEQSRLDLCCVFGNSCSASCILNKCEIPAFQSDSVVNITSCHFSDVLSLVELLAYNMSWDWTCTTIFSELLRMLESPLQESFTVAIVILLGQLGRIGVDACGYEDKEVESLRNKLSAFLMGDTTIVAALPVQIATVTALLGLLPLDFEQIVEINAKHPIISSQSVPADCIRKWFSLLSKKHQALSASLLQSLG